MGPGSDRHSASISPPRPAPPRASDPDVPNFKERLAYAVEWGIKIAYPIAFLVFNAFYWGFYL